MHSPPSSKKKMLQETIDRICDIRLSRIVSTGDNGKVSEFKLGFSHWAEMFEPKPNGCD